MTDRELLEAAAKAAGITLEKDSPWFVYGDPYGFSRLNDDGSLVKWRWNPLHDDGDALRLAVKLNLHIGIDAESAGSIVVEWDFDSGGSARQSIDQDAPLGGDDYAATRRAIVRAAAALAEKP